MAAIVLPIERKDALRRALTLLQQGEAIAFPTDTVYGVGAAGLNGVAVARLFAVKERPLSQAIPLLLWDAAELRTVCPAVPIAARELGARYWPGALTLVVPAAAHLPAELLAGVTTVAVRVPHHPWLRELIRLLGQPLAATSANLHGGADPATAQAVAEQLGVRLPLIIDGGPTPGDIPSTIVDVTGARPKVLRSGSLAVEF